ncbi:MAG: ATP-binding cassette domain-containing protein [Lachnospiraceae bacterium]|nr:ATP-binding cassette domain-containing protein [Lachnospiraceae bacterium]
MHDTIEICGIETNNLKNIDVALKKHSINLIIGPSGSGKSSLAYDTIARIGQNEMMSMFADEVPEPTYKVQSYKNMIATVPIRQTNNNNNIRSTIGTYFGLNPNVALVYAALLKLDEDFFVLNKEENTCSQCHGLGFLNTLDINRLIDYDVPIEKCPVRCWVRNRDFYIQIIKHFCEDVGIDYKKNFRMLTEKEKQIFLYGESENKYSIKYKRAGIRSSRTTKYYGIMTNTPMLSKFVVSKQFCTDEICPSCKGFKYSPKHNEYRLYNLSIGELMCTPFEELQNWLDNIVFETLDSTLSFAVLKIIRFIEKAVELGLGHLFLHRAIPTLSGGEMQRLRLVQVFNTQLSDLLIVLDEPLAGLSSSEKQTVYNNIMELSEHHALLIVDHHDIFVRDAEIIIALGEKSGKDGGNIIDVSNYIESQKFNIDYKPMNKYESYSLMLQNTVYNYKGANLEIGKNCLNIIFGKSGVGKSTLLREYLPQHFENYVYINQKVLLGNKNSTVATALDVLENITNLYAKHFKKSKSFFSKTSNGEGACPSCFGVGYVEYGNDFQIKAQIECRACKGTGFNKKLKQYGICDKSIVDVWKMTIDEASFFFQELDNRIVNILYAASEIMLGHLQLGQPTATLSGGENIRIKVLKSIKSNASIYGIDEPFKGLNRTEVYKLVRFFANLTNEKKTVIVADHEEESFCFFTKRIQLINKDGILVGINQE